MSKWLTTVSKNMHVTTGAEVYVNPRDARVFMEATDYSIRAKLLLSSSTLVLLVVIMPGSFCAATRSRSWPHCQDFRLPMLSTVQDNKGVVAGFTSRLL